jgi:hypothetical protein
MPVTISAEQRDAIYTQILDHLSGLGDLFLVVKSGDYRKAESLGQSFVDDLRLLDDLGWPDAWNQRADGSVELTLDPDELGRVLGRLRQEATGLFADTFPRSDDDHAILRQTALVIEACGRVLRMIDREEDRG